MSCNASIFTANTTSTVLTTGSTIPLGSVVRRFGQALALNGNAINASSVGYYNVAASITIEPTAAGDIQVQLLRNGVAVPGGTASSTVAAAGDPANLAICAMVRKACACGDPVELSLVLIGGGTVTNAAVVVEKV